MSKAIVQVLTKAKPRRRPIWFMRQAGRYLPEYRALRAKAGSFLKLCYDPALAAEVTIQPLRRFDLDAAIVFADILVVPHAMGVGLKFAEGEGPVLEKIASPERVRGLLDLVGAWQVEKVCKTLDIVRHSLDRQIALIGFCGAPWTVASYMIGGGAAEGREPALLAALNEEPWFKAIMEKLVENSVNYLVAQVEAGAEVLQIFDSWAGELPAHLMESCVIEPIAQIRQELARRFPHVPVIVFARGVGAGHAEVAKRTGADAVSLESSVPLTWARDVLSKITAVQGNLDPLALTAKDAGLVKAVQAITSALPKERHIFNLGHGVRQATDPGRLARTISLVREYDRDG